MKFAKFPKLTLICTLLLATLVNACHQKPVENQNVPSKSNQLVTAKEILGNSEYLAISYGGYRTTSRDNQPTIDQLKDDMKILSAMGIKVLRTYNVHFAQAENLLKAIRELKQTQEGFEMYVMLGAWINCKGAFTDNPNHELEDEAANQTEIDKAVALANEYKDIVKIIAVGNEAMVKWATSYFVEPAIILKWVNHLQGLKESGALPKDLWITSSDNFASWGGGEELYHTPELEQLVSAVDYISLHTYPMHDTHYNPEFWGVDSEEADWSDTTKIMAAMDRALTYAVTQYSNTKKYINSLGIDKPIHIGETGWASVSNGFYGETGSKATDEYKEAMFYQLIKDWSHSQDVSCFYFEAFDEPWKDANNQLGSENHFGLFTVKGEAKYALWSLVDAGVFDGLTRDGHPITKTYQGNVQLLLESVSVPTTRDFSQP